VDLQNAVTTLAEDAGTTPRRKVADIVVTDDGLGTNVLSLAGEDAALFEIDGDGLYLKSGTVLDHETNPVLNVTVAVDDATLGGTPDDAGALIIDVTNAPPWVTVDQAEGQGDPTNEWTILFTAVFSEPVADFAAGDVALGGSAGASDVMVTDVDGGLAYRIAVTGMTRSGTVTVAIPADAAHDGAGAGNLASVSADNCVEYTAPSFHNPDSPCDVNRDGIIEALDVLLIVNYINAHPGDSSLPKPPAQPPPYYDVDNDGLCAAGDALAVINYINGHPNYESEGEAEGLIPASPFSNSSPSHRTVLRIRAEDAVARKQTVGPLRREPSPVRNEQDCSHPSP
jgi:hypothetical protein